MRFITDRTQANVDRVKELKAKGRTGMTVAEWAEFSGDPLLSDRFNHNEPVNLVSGIDAMTTSVRASYDAGTIRVSAYTAGTHRYGIAILGAAEYFENKVLTLSVGSLTVDGGQVRVAPYWHDERGSYTAINAFLSDTGSISFQTGENTDGRAYLALYFYATVERSATAGAYVEYRDVMVEFGDTAHEFVEYTPIIATRCTKGAYNYTDLNRVERAVKTLSDLLGLGLTTKTDWTALDKPRVADMNRYLENIRILRTTAGGMVGTPAVPATMSGLNHVRANNIEKILSDISTTVDAVLWCGDVFSGEV